MFQGFYNLTSGILTQSRSLNVISNNMSNAETPGFKADRAMISSFREELVNRMDSRETAQTARIGRRSMITTVDEIVTDDAQGAVRQTGRPLNFALYGKGYFCIQTEQGTVYTRDGAFSMDEEGYLCLPGVGRVLGEDGPIRMETDQIFADEYGNIYNSDATERLGKLMVVDFAEGQQVKKNGMGNVFTSEGNTVQADASVQWKALEDSNADPLEQMTRMMASQRALQSSAQILKLYDQLEGKMVTELGPV